jgi:hypothetical protein
MNQQRARIKERIRKLLALSESPYEAEAAAALAKAQALLSREGLALSDFVLDADGVVELAVAAGIGISPWEKKLLKCVLSATYTGALRAYRNKEEELIIIGREVNAVTAKILYEYLHETVRRKADTFRDSIDDLESFRIGMVDSIQKKFQDQEQASHASSVRRDIIVAMEQERLKENRDYIKEHYGTPNSSDEWYGVDPNSFGLGQGIGKKISINRQISSVDRTEEQ